MSLRVATASHTVFLDEFTLQDTWGLTPKLIRQGVPRDWALLGRKGMRHTRYRIDSV